MKYVISEDIDIVLGSWCEKQGFCLPGIYFFYELRQEMHDYLESIFGQGNVDMVSAAELIVGITEFVKKPSINIVSIDRVYFPTQPAIEINRTVDLSLKDNGLGPRFGFEPIQMQTEKIAKRCPLEIVLVDDVIFSGNGISDIIDLLNTYNIQVQSVITGIAIGNGLEHLKQKKIEVQCVKFYPEVIDEICERDFYPGLPMSGRLVVGMNANIGASYLLPFGKPEEWASIPPEHTKKFSIFCLQQSIKLWQEVEKTSNQYVLISDLDRQPLGITNKSMRITEALKKAQEAI